MKKQPFAFVLMPFAQDFDDIYKLGIQGPAGEAGVLAERVDEQIFTETMLQRIYRQIDVADFIIADMTGRNPNVFYEVGYAHAKDKLCVLLTQSAEDIPFDLKQHRHLVYGASIQTLRRQLAAEIEWVLSELDKRATRTLSVELKSLTGLLVKAYDWRADAEVEMVLDMFNRTDRRSPEIDALYLHTGGGWKYTQNGQDCPSSDSERPPFKTRHFLTPPLARLGPGHWAQLRAKGTKQVWTKWDGTELKDSYRLVGPALLEIVTSEGTVSEQLDLDVTADEIPF